MKVTQNTFQRIPAATSTVRDMSDIRFEIPEFIASKCTGCSQCWTQCPDAAIPGLVNSVEDVIQAAIRTAQNGKPLDRIQSISANLAREARKTLKAVPFTTFGDTVATAYRTLADKLPWDAERKKALDEVRELAAQLRLRPRHHRHPSAELVHARRLPSASS